MPDIGIRELKTRVSEIVREVREQRVRYVVTHRGRPVALLSPLEQAGELELISREQPSTAWDDLTRLGEEIGLQWQSEKNSAELLSDMRR